MTGKSDMHGASKPEAGSKSTPTQLSTSTEPPTKSEIQLLIQETLDIPEHLTSRFNHGDIHMAYTRYLAVEDAQRRINKMRTDGTWTERKPTLQEFAGLFMSKSSYFNQKQVFSLVPNYPEVEKWLLNLEDAPSDAALWGAKRVTFERLKKKVEKGGKGKHSSTKKGKERQIEYESSSEKIADKKGKGKAVGGSKKASSSKDRD